MSFYVIEIPHQLGVHVWASDRRLTDGELEERGGDLSSIAQVGSLLELMDYAAWIRSGHKGYEVINAARVELVVLWDWLSDEERGSLLRLSEACAELFGDTIVDLVAEGLGVDR